MESLSIKRNTLVFLLSNFLVSVAYSLPHSILTVILLAKGLSLSQILIIQSAYSIAIVLFEFPSGLLADNYSRKNLYSLSKLFLIIMFLIVLFSNQFYLIFAAWFCYGIAAALDSGTLDAYIINQLKLAHREAELRKFLALSNRLEIVGLLLGSSLGGILYHFIGINIYVLGTVFLVASTLISFFFFKETTKSESLQDSHVMVLKKQITDSFKELRKQPRLSLILIFDFLTQIFFQTHFQLWQSFFLSKGIDSQYFPFFYIAFQVITLFSYSINIDGIKKYAGVLKFSPLIVFLPLTFFLGKIEIFLTAYFIFVFVFYVIEFILNYQFNKMVSVENISSLISFKSTVSRIGSVLLLCILSFMVKQMSVSAVMAINFMLSLVLLAVLSVIIMKKAVVDSDVK
ncbi:multidrug MFS transporter [Streptococcus equinus ATCC 33317]|uniref:MFS transporter n=1 Tax=Streptococcus equinus TaxID=1335 RepID=UPI00050592E9|nr:MFS transporter [Streptococcus equinus]KFN86623.1 multidrug MFS transporter [Streptococcus equinus ATCC 33317]SDQ37873.1 Major Facilitator Superfamily protein [Streptococcus equinus]SEN77324.1 Major Facilitator Superfamily protein [Streptococcus equinus]VED93258.1 major facilitator superfamily protein [Streptococcus equinus]VTS91329.1 major facilitator superfamily protein [Streptococcus equinus]